MELEKAKAIAEALKERLAPACERVSIAGSIRRRKPDVGDIELLAIPKVVKGEDMLNTELAHLIFQGVLRLRLNKGGQRTYGPKNKLLVHVRSGIGVDIFSTTEECWPVALTIRTGSKEFNIAIATAAQKKGWHLLAYGEGFNTPQGVVVCHTEREVFEKVGIPYKEPWER